MLHSRGIKLQVRQELARALNYYVETFQCCIKFQWVAMFQLMKSSQVTKNTYLSGEMIDLTKGNLIKQLFEM